MADNFSYYAGSGDITKKRSREIDGAHIEINGGVTFVLDSTLKYLIPLDSLPQTILADGSGIVAGPDPTNGGVSWKQTITAAANGDKTFSAWVRQ